MLSPNDVHYVIGFLTSISSPESVEIELGDMIYDEAAESERDVDITIKFTSTDGKLTMFRGYEVKGHKRPLDVAHVEQLCMKFKDMPSIDERAIVSASGFTDSALKKAVAHGVDLYDLKDWTDFKAESFEHVVMRPDLKFSEIQLSWSESPHILLLSDDATEADLEELDELSKKNPPVVDINGKPFPTCADMHALGLNLMKNALDSLTASNADAIPFGSPTKVEFKINVSDTPCIQLRKRMFEINKAVLTGRVLKSKQEHPMLYKVFVKHGEEKPIAGCCIAEISIGNLVGFSLGNNRKLGFFNVPVSDRNKAKIFRQKLIHKHSGLPNHLQ